MAFSYAVRLAVASAVVCAVRLAARGCWRVSPGVSVQYFEALASCLGNANMEYSKYNPAWYLFIILFNWWRDYNKLYGMMTYGPPSSLILEPLDQGIKQQT